MTIFFFFDVSFSFLLSTVVEIVLTWFSSEFQLQVGTKLQVIGWGATMDGGPVVNVLRDVEVTVLAHSECQTAYPNQYQSDRMFCVGDQAGGKDACQVRYVLKFLSFSLIYNTNFLIHF